MTTVTLSHLTTALRRSAVRATRAPSVHNTQPWRMVIAGDTLEIRSDRSRQLTVLDPYGRQLLLSCGCALFNARVSLAASGVGVVVRRFPDPEQPDLLARLTVEAGCEPDMSITGLEPAIDRRQTNRRTFSPEPVPVGLLDRFVAAGVAEGADVLALIRPEDRLAAARLSQQADAIERADPAYLTELRAWTSTDPSRPDGVPASVVPADGVEPVRRDTLPIRDFGLDGSAGLPEARSTADQTLLLVGSFEDNPMAWLRSGEALERVLLQIALHGYTASYFTQVIEVSRTNLLLRQELRLHMHPHVLLRVGRAPATPATRRRRLVDVLSET